MQSVIKKIKNNIYIDKTLSIKTIGIFIIFSIIGCTCSCSFETEYSGKIIGREIIVSGKYHSEKHYILLQENKTNKVIRVYVTVPYYYGVKEGESATFKISNLSLYNAGNTNDKNKNLYGE